MSFPKLLLVILLFLSTTTLLSQREKKGGYIYGWNNYTDDFTDGLGTREIEWDSTNVAIIKHAPNIGIHPRVYFGPSEMPDILNRLNTTSSGQEIKALMHAYTTLLHLEYVRSFGLAKYRFYCACNSCAKQSIEFSNVSKAQPSKVSSTFCFCMFNGSKCDIYNVFGLFGSVVDCRLAYLGLINRAKY